MPLRYGVSFPAWFHPQYEPTAPIAPKVPQQRYFEKRSVLVKTIHVGGISIPKIMDILEDYDEEEYYIDNIDYGDNTLSLMKEEQYEVVLDEKEFLKKEKDYARFLKEYEKAEAEYKVRMKKYPAMCYMHEDAKLREFLVKAEDELEDLQIQDSNSQIALYGLRESIAQTKHQLNMLKGRFEFLNSED